MAFLCQAPSGDDIMEEREELMASATGGIQQLRIAHFLKPIVPSIKASNLKLPYLSPRPRWPLHVDFNGWRDPQKKWENWVDQMQSKHQSLWEKAGIFEAIMCSKYKFHRNNDLFFGIAERWCSETNTFVFTWGEATITLEDMMILGGFSVLGSPVLLPLAGKELVEIDMSLKKVLKNFVRMKRHSHLQWLNFFMESGKRYEHEAFLSLWLSRFVFPGNEFDQIGEHLFPIAVHLARGMRMALAPAVLASIYRDLSLLKVSMAASRSLEDESGEDSILALSLWAPLQLVQIWAWERFLMFRPEPNFLSFGDPRAARWHDIKRSDVGNVRPIIDSSGDIFMWRPYTLSVDQWKFPEFYREIEQWAHVGQCPDEALQSFARCLRACVLFGFDCEEPYQPHRVAMQFGLDQDIPELVPRSVESVEVAWINYSKPLNYAASFYIPARLFESDLSIQYQQWWRKSVLVPVDSFRGVSRGLRSSRMQHRRDLATSRETGVEGIPGCSGTPVVKRQVSTQQQFNMESNDTDVPPGFLSKRNLTPIRKIETSAKMQIRGEGNNTDVALGFPSKHNHPRTIRPETSGEKQSIQKSNVANVPVIFPPKKNHALRMRPETPSKKPSKEGNEAAVPPGFSPKTNHALPTRLETPGKKPYEEEGYDATVSHGFPPKKNHALPMRLETPSKEPSEEEGNDAAAHPGFTPKENHALTTRPETSSKKPSKGEGNDDAVPPGFPPKKNHALIMRPGTPCKKPSGGEGNDATVPPGFAPKKNHALTMRPETSSKKQRKGEGNDTHMSPGFPPKRYPTPMMSPQTSTELQTKTEGNNADVPPGFPPKLNHNLIPRPTTPTKPLIISDDTDLNVSHGFLAKYNHDPLLRPETSTELHQKAEVFDLNLPPVIPPEFNSFLEQNPTSGGILQRCNNGWSSNYSAANALQPSSTSQIQANSSSAASAIGTSGSVQPSRIPVERTINTGNAGSTGHANRTNNGNLVRNFVTINENGVDSSCAFTFGSQILVNMQACLNRVRSEVGNQPHGSSKIGDFFQFGGKTM